MNTVIRVSKWAFSFSATFIFATPFLAAVAFLFSDSQVFYDLVEKILMVLGLFAALFLTASASEIEPRKKAWFHLSGVHLIFSCTLLVMSVCLYWATGQINELTCRILSFLRNRNVAPSDTFFEISVIRAILIGPHILLSAFLTFSAIGKVLDNMWNDLFGESWMSVFKDKHKG